MQTCRHRTLSLWRGDAGLSAKGHGTCGLLKALSKTWRYEDEDHMGPATNGMEVSLGEESRADIMEDRMLKLGLNS